MGDTAIAFTIPSGKKEISVLLKLKYAWEGNFGKKYLSWSEMCAKL